MTKINHSPEKEYILVINSGSATLKFKIFRIADFSLQLNGIVERIGLAGSFINIEEKVSRRIVMKNYPEGIKDHVDAMGLAAQKIEYWRDKIEIIGHRVVHGGGEFFVPTNIDSNTLDRLAQFNELSPLHNPINLTCAKECLRLWSGVQNIAVFDTAFYKDLPNYAYTYALPYEISQKYKIRRYGFHGISHNFVAEQAAKKLKQPLEKLKLITCHLGSGSSITAIKFGQAIDTSMGFTPLEGLVMGTRAGNIDPIIPLFLQKKLNLNLDKIEELLNKKSGLLGVFGSADMRDILTASGHKVEGYQELKNYSDEEVARAKLALNVFVYNAVKYIGSYAVALDGVDAIVFTAGIGERSQSIRQLIKRQLKLLRGVKYLVVPTDEELMIAKQILFSVTRTA